MIELETILKEFPKFLAKYGDVEYELDIFEVYKNYGENQVVKLHRPDRYVNCKVTLPDVNDGKQITLNVVYEGDGTFRRLDVWGKRAGIPFP